MDKSENLRPDAPCPFCGSAPIKANDERACNGFDCPISHIWISATKWNSRPLRPVAYAIVSERGGIYKMAIQRSTAEGKLKKRLAEPETNGMNFHLETLYIYK